MLTLLSSFLLGLEIKKGRVLRPKIVKNSHK